MGVLTTTTADHAHSKRQVATTTTKTVVCHVCALCLIFLGYAGLCIDQQASNEILSLQQTQDDNADTNKILLSLQESSNCTTTTTLTATTTTSNSARKTKKQQRSIWVPSFPGSGAELFRELVTTITLQPTIDGALKGHCQPDKYVTCKTHWPVLNASRFQDPNHHYKDRKSRQYDHPSKQYHVYSPQTIVLIRNPMHAIPSWYNQIYETRGNVGYHAKQAPLTNWKKWIQRHNQLVNALQEWMDLILYWFHHEYYQVALVIPFENLTHVTHGPRLLQQVANVFQSQGSPTVPANNDDNNNMECLWNFCVQQQKGMKRAPHKYKPPYLQEHQQLFVSTIQNLAAGIRRQQQTTTQQVHDYDNANNYKVLLNALQEYQKEIEQFFEVFEKEDKEKHV